MSAAVIQQVKPTGVRLEAVALAAATLVVVAFLLWWARAHGREEQVTELYEWQVSAFETLTGADQAIYNALYTAKDDILYIYDDINLMVQPSQKFHWPSIKDLNDALLPPFLEDGSWEQNGSLQWQLHEPLSEGEMQGAVMYLGTDGKAPAQGSFLLVIAHVHAGFSNNNHMLIWWNPANHMTMPESGYQDQLILRGWRQVVPHSGEAEVKRIFGDDAPQADEPVDDAATADSIASDLFEETK